MNLCFRDKVLSETRVPTKEDLIVRLNEYDNNVMLSEPESHTSYGVLSVSEGGRPTLGIGLAMICDVPISVRILEEWDSILIGYNLNFALVDCAEKKTVFDIPLDSYFCYAKAYPSAIFVLSETSAYLVSYTGEIRNRMVFEDLLEFYHFAGDCFEYTTYASNGSRRKISLKTFGAF